MSGIRRLDFDGVIVGGGGSGMRASLQLAQSGLKTAVIYQGISHPIAYRVCPGRHYLCDRQ